MSGVSSQPGGSSRWRETPTSVKSQYDLQRLAPIFLWSFTQLRSLMLPSVCHASLPKMICVEGISSVISGVEALPLLGSSSHRPTSGCPYPLSSIDGELAWQLKTIQTRVEKILLVAAATGSGKSKWLQSVLVTHFPGRWLVLTPSGIDIQDMYSHARHSAGYHKGRGVDGGSRSGDLMFVTVGLAVK